MTATANWFEVDRKGLAKLLERRGKEFVIYELLSNALDTDAKEIDITLEAKPGRPLAELIVTDDHPNGWSNLDHAYTLFAESEKKGDAEKRGRFNIGEKLVLALCEQAVIATTTGTVTFDGGGRQRSKTKTDKGSQFEAIVRMTREELEGVSKAVMRVLVPEGVGVKFNGTRIPYRKPLRRIEATLPTEIADAEGMLRRTSRKTFVEAVEVLPGETATIFELGIPVVETGDKWHYNIFQKVPLNSDRDNVTPAYLREVRTLVVNEMYTEVTPAEATSKWARDVAEDEDISKEAMTHLITQRFGEKRVIADPSDPEGTKLAVAQDYQVIQPGSLSGDEWRNVKRYAAALPAGQVTPSPKPYSPSGDPLEELRPEKWTAGIQRIAEYAKMLAGMLLSKQITVRVVNKATWPYGATYGPSGELVLNVGRLGYAWFDQEIGESVDELLLHEFAHDWSGDHLSEAYHDGLCKLGARLATLCLRKPQLLKSYGRTVSSL